MLMVNLPASLMDTLNLWGKVELLGTGWQGSKLIGDMLSDIIDRGASVEK